MLSLHDTTSSYVCSRELHTFTLTLTHTRSHTLTHTLTFPYRYQRSDILSLLLTPASSEARKRLPSHYNPDLATSIREEAGKCLRQHKGQWPCYFFTHLCTFTLPTGEFPMYTEAYFSIGLLLASTFMPSSDCVYSNTITGYGSTLSILGTATDWILLHFYVHMCIYMYIHVCTCTMYVHCTSTIEGI